MKFLITAALIAAVATPALAQLSGQYGATSGSATTGSAASNSGVPGPTKGEAPADRGANHSANTGQRTGVSASASNMPSSWSGTPGEWTTHSQACAKRYPSYEASTDMYTNNGKSSRCMLSMGKNGSSSR